ncbi:MAG: beta-lactamase family protein [Planctomycetaceae bacterium]|nr:beta-lactamase family protein [Planctomycetaceae bacterium]
MFPTAEFPTVAAAIQDGIDRQLHTGVQIYVSLGNSIVLDSAIGNAAPDRPITTSTLMPWRSAGKPLTAFLIMQLIEAQCLKLSTRLPELLPEFDDTDKADVTVFDLLTHQSGFPQTETGWPHCSWQESIRNIRNSPRQLEIGTAAYHPQSSWFLLGEILRRLDHAPQTSEFNGISRQRLLNPLHLQNTRCGLEPDEAILLADRMPVIWERDKGKLVESNYGRIPWTTQASPGASFRGPVRELGQFYEMLLRGGRTSSGERLLAADLVEQMVERHRIGEFDQTLQHKVDFGLGVVCNSNRYGAESVPYGFGQYCSEASYGHGGAQCSMGFCDSARQLVVAWAANGFCGEGMHQRRNRTINNAIYADLGFV